MIFLHKIFITIIYLSGLPPGTLPAAKAYWRRTNYLAPYKIWEQINYAENTETRKSPGGYGKKSSPPLKRWNPWNRYCTVEENLQNGVLMKKIRVGLWIHLPSTVWPDNENDPPNKKGKGSKFKNNFILPIKCSANRFTIYICVCSDILYYPHRRRIQTEEKAKVVAVVCGTALVKFRAALAIFHHDDLKKSMNRITGTWRNGCFEKMDEHPVHTIPNHSPTKIDVLPKTFVQVIFAAKWLVRHSSMSPQPTATTFAFSSVFFLLLWLWMSPKSRVSCSKSYLEWYWRRWWGGGGDGIN